jgi:hypothetical protein
MKKNPLSFVLPDSLWIVRFEKADPMFLEDSVDYCVKNNFYPTYEVIKYQTSGCGVPDRHVLRCAQVVLGLNRDKFCSPWIGTGFFIPFIRQFVNIYEMSDQEKASLDLYSTYIVGLECRMNFIDLFSRELRPHCHAYVKRRTTKFWALAKHRCRGTMKGMLHCCDYLIEARVGRREKGHVVFYPKERIRAVVSPKRPRALGVVLQTSLEYYADPRCFPVIGRLPKVFPIHLNINGVGLEVPYGFGLSDFNEVQHIVVDYNATGTTNVWIPDRVRNDHCFYCSALLPGPWCSRMQWALSRREVSGFWCGFDKLRSVLYRWDKLPKPMNPAAVLYLAKQRDSDYYYMLPKILKDVRRINDLSQWRCSLCQGIYLYCWCGQSITVVRQVRHEEVGEDEDEISDSCDEEVLFNSLPSDMCRDPRRWRDFNDDIKKLIFL